MNNEGETKFSWSDLFEIWMMAYKKGYETGYMDRARGHEYNPTAYTHPPEVLKKIFESNKGESEE